jgi:CheY-like chemotaxis protein
MPGMDGIELCGQIRAIEVYKDTPIIMNTAVADRDYIDAAFAAGATDYLTKPVDEVEVKARLGVIEQLVTERLRSQIALSHPGIDVFNAPSYGFLDGIPLKRVEGAMDLFSMGNYLKTLGLFRALTISAIGIRVLNARAIHDLEGGHVFGEVMIDVATCISDCLKPSNRMIAYAGRRHLRLPDAPQRGGNPRFSPIACGNTSWNSKRSTANLASSFRRSRSACPSPCAPRS